MAPTRSQEESLLNSILPSYHMFRATLSQTLQPSNENFREDPPMYELSPANSGVCTPGVSLAPISLAEFLPEDEHLLFSSKSEDFWEKTVMANVHRLGTALGTVASHLKVGITVTRAVCQKGIAPEIISIDNREFRQGDYIHGYVTIENTHEAPVPFDMVYVVFEGSLALAGPRTLMEQPQSMYKFLNMPDLFASWLYANIDRLTTDNGDPHDWCEGETDPYDGAVLAIDVKRIFMPGVRYKRFFLFRVPEKLLDDACETHSLNLHCQVPPSLGKSHVRDLAFVDTFVDYTIACRVVGRASHYKRVKKDHYILAAERSLPVRVVPYTTQPEYRSLVVEQRNAAYRAFVESVEQKIEQGQLLASPALSPVLSRPSLYPQDSSDSLVRLKQEYRQAGDKDARVYQHMFLYRKKTLTLTKALGVFSLSTPKVEYSIPYVPPPKYRDGVYSAVINVPVELLFLYEGHTAPPEPKGIAAELVVFTAKAKKHYIPVEITHDMLFRDHVVECKKPLVETVENFNTLVVRPFANHYRTLVSLIRRAGTDNEAFKVETQLFRNVKSMAGIQTKFINMTLPDIKITSVGATSEGVHATPASIPWTPMLSDTYNVLTKKMELAIDVGLCLLKGHDSPASGFDHVTLVPDFQMCLMARLYYVRIMVKHQNGAMQCVHVPLTISR